ncbi:uncharacterized protein ATNIH1004_001762 [Aspergillus tanneri]|uniref:Uncharacterized protein n=1 Tax=Aspergillus tanneri TaxID=1220188 RepID=A0A5M9N6F2_9EURO|nr:uncharacterized protein ATNIH1004_001762 [Aspergillus tanneri]KAA8652853.1 hypothetical protein ATNIH1004_001762 [Aspergillus tanneri]
MPRANLDRDPITLQEGGHVAARIGGKLIEPDTMEYVDGEVESITIYRTPNSDFELKCTQDVDFEPGEQVILQQLDPVSYALIGMKSGKEVEFKE